MLINDPVSRYRLRIVLKAPDFPSNTDGQAAVESRIDPVAASAAAQRYPLLHVGFGYALRSKLLAEAKCAVVSWASAALQLVLAPGVGIKCASARSTSWRDVSTTRCSSCVDFSLLLGVADQAGLAAGFGIPGPLGVVRSANCAPRAVCTREMAYGKGLVARSMTAVRRSVEWFVP